MGDVIQCKSIGYPLHLTTPPLTLPNLLKSFFELLKSVLDEYKFTADAIYNMDETGVSFNPKSQSGVVALKGRRQVSTKTSAERGTNVTAVIALQPQKNICPPH